MILGAHVVAGATTDEEVCVMPWRAVIEKIIVNNTTLSNVNVRVRLVPAQQAVADKYSLCLAYQLTAANTNTNRLEISGPIEVNGGDRVYIYSSAINVQCLVCARPWSEKADPATVPEAL